MHESCGARIVFARHMIYLTRTLRSGFTRVSSSYLGPWGRHSWRLHSATAARNNLATLGHNLAVTEIHSLPCDKEHSPSSRFLHSSYTLLTRSRESAWLVRVFHDWESTPSQGWQRHCGVKWK